MLASSEYVILDATSPSESLSQNLEKMGFFLDCKKYCCRVASILFAYSDTFRKPPKVQCFRDFSPVARYFAYSSDREQSFHAMVNSTRSG